MANTCIIKRGPNRRIERVSTPSGQQSELFDKIASIPLIGNRDRAVSFFKNVFSNKFLKEFGNWMKYTPKNLQAYRSIKKNIDLIPEVSRVSFLEKAADMDNPIMLNRVNMPENTNNLGLSYYTADLKKGEDIYLLDAVGSREIDLSKDNIPDGMDKMEYMQSMVNMTGGAINEVTDIDGNKYMAIQDVIRKYTPAELTDSTVSPAFVYNTGEPRLFFLTEEGGLYDDYGSALRNTTGKSVRAGFVSGAARDVIAGVDATVSVSTSGTGMKLNDMSSFISMMSIDTNTNPATKNGLINYLIKKGYLSGSRVYNRDTNTYHFTGAGNTPGMRSYNSALAYHEIANHLGYSRVTVDDNGFITIKDKDNNKIAMMQGNKIINVNKEDIVNGLKAGKYNELKRKYGNFDAIVLSLIMSDGVMYEDTINTLLTNAKKEDINQRNAIVKILSTLGVRVVGMTDYIDKYKAKNGVEPTARALADIANGVIAVAENATMTDVMEEVAHFLVEGYGNQTEINEILDQVENAEEWNQYAGQYYQVYKNMYKGSELDNAVRREILGKILAGRMSSSYTETEATDTSFLSSVRTLADNMVNYLRNMLGGQRKALNDVVEKISDMAFSDNMSGFDRSLLESDMYTMYSLDSNNLRQDFLKRQSKNLRKVLSKFRQIRADRAVTAEMSLNELRKIEKNINDAESGIIDNDIMLAISSILNTVDAQVEYIKTITKEALRTEGDGKMKLKPSDRAAVDIMDNQVLPLLKEMYGFINNHLDLETDTSGNIKNSYITKINKSMAEINAVKADVDAVLNIDKNTFFTSVLDYLNIPIEARDGILDMLNRVQKDINVVARWFGILENSNNIINRSLDALISKNYAEAMGKTQSEIGRFLEEAKKGNWDVKKFRSLIQRDPNGALSNYLKSAINMAAFERNYKIAQMKALRQVVENSDDLSKLTDKEIEEVVDKGDGFYFTRTINEGGGTKTVTSFVKPNIDNRIGTDIMTLEEEQNFNDLMNQWKEENEEQPYLESYRERRKRIIEEAQGILGYGAGETISADTIEFMEHQSRQKYILKNNPEFYDADGKFNFFKFANSINYREYNRLQKQRNEMSSSYMYVGGERVEKTGNALRMAKELTAIKEAYAKEYSKEAPAKMISEQTIRTIEEIQREHGAKAAWQFLTVGGHLSFAGEELDNAVSGTDASLHERLYKAIMSSDEILDDDPDVIQAAYDAINEAKSIMKDILKFNRSNETPGEIDFDGMTEEEINTIKVQSEVVERNMRLLRNKASNFGIDMAGLYDFGSETEYSVNQTYWSHLKDSGLPEYKFALKHTTAAKAAYIESFYKRMTGTSLSKRFSKSERKFLYEKLGLNPNIDDKRYKAELHKAIKDKIGDREESSFIEELVGEYARRMVLPYFKRVSPAGFSQFTKMIENNESPMIGRNISISQMIRDMQSGVSTQDYGFDLSKLKFEPNREWLSEEAAERNDINPNYKKGNDYGRFCPKKSLYQDNDYINYFGIEERDGVEYATRNQEEFKMLQSLKDMMARSLDMYGIKNKSIYQIPQVSAQSLDKFSNLGWNPKSVAENMAREFVTDQIDDSLYGRTSVGESIDEAERFKAIPKYYIYELAHKSDVSHDFAYSYPMLLAQAHLYEEKSNTYDYVMGMEQVLLNMQFNNGKKAEATKSYAMFKDFVNNHFYGIRVNSGKMNFTVAGRTVDLNRVAMAAERAMSVMNLALSPFVAITGALTGQINFLVEGAVGQYIDKDSIAYAYKEISRNMPDWLSEIGDIDRNSKLYLTGERIGIFNLKDRLYGAGYSRFVRTVTRDPMFKMMEIANAPLEPQVMIAVLDSVRLYNGSFYTFDELKAMMQRTGDRNLDNIKEVWRKARKDSLWNLLDYEGQNIKSTNPNISNDLVSNELIRRRGLVKSLAQICTGSLSQENKTAASRNIIGRFLTAHRGWMTLIGERIYKKNGYNFKTMRNEEGLVQTILYMMKKTYEMTSEKGISNIIQSWRAEFKNMPPEAQVNAKRLAVYAGMYIAMQFVVAALSGWRNDDDEKDDWLAQFVTYIGLRTVNEIASQMPGIYEMSIVDAIQDPFVAGRKLGDMINVNNYSFDKVTSGNYKDETKIFRHLARMTFIKQWYNIRTPEAVRQTSEWWLQSNEKVMSLFYGGKRQSAEKENED